MKVAQSKLVPWRLAVVTLVIGVIICASWWLIAYGTAAMPTRCMFHQWTGLHCPGCGMTSATYAVFQGKPLVAFGLNPLGVIIFPVAIVGTGLEAFGWVRNTAPPWRIPLGRHGAKAIAFCFIAFMILRNLPWFPFTWLAP